MLSDLGFWSSVISGVISGAAATLAAALVITGASAWRSGRASALVLQSVRAEGLMIGDQFGVSLANPTDVRVIVRSVTLLTNVAGVRLWYKPNSFIPRDERLTATVSRSHAERGYVELPPKDKGDWLVEFNTINPIFFDSTAESLEFVFEHQTLLGGTVVASGKVSGFVAERIPEQWKSFLEANHKKHKRKSGRADGAANPTEADEGTDEPDIDNP